MRRVVFILVLAFYSNVVNAQLVYGPEAGLSICGAKYEAPSNFRTISLGQILGAKVGVIADISLSTHLFFQTGLFFDVKGFTKSIQLNESADTVFERVDQSMQINYLQVPVNVLIKTGVQGQGRIFFGLGATIGYTVGGRNLFHGYGHFPQVAFDIGTNSRIDGGTDVTRADAALNFILGYELPSGLFFRSYYSMGFTNILVDEGCKNRSLGISVGYLLHNNRRQSIVKELIAE